MSFGDFLEKLGWCTFCVFVVTVFAVVLTDVYRQGMNPQDDYEEIDFQLDVRRMEQQVRGIGRVHLSNFSFPRFENG